MALNQSQVANPHLPVADDKELRKIVLAQGVPVVWRAKTTKCPDGWIRNFHDPECTTCSNSSGYIFTDILIKGVFQERDPHGLYNSGNIRTVAGTIERYDAEFYTEVHIGRPIRLDDLLIYSRDYDETDLELTVMAKKSLTGTKGRSVGFRFLLFKSPRTDTISPDTNKRI